MNLLLLFDEDFRDAHHVHLTGRRFLHVKDILKAAPGKELSVGKINGLTGQGNVTALGTDALEMEVSLTQPPPVALPLTLIMAMARPPMLRRTLQCAASLGIKKIIILNSSKVEKSLWQSSSLRPESMKQDLILGLEQAKDTILPEVILQKKFKPFVEDELPLLIEGKTAFVAHPGAAGRMPGIENKETVLMIGPEGGFSDFEVDLFKSKGVRAVTLGERILRFEHVIPYAIGKLTR